MTLHFKRSQKELKSLMGKVKGIQFTLEARLELTAAEQTLADRYTAKFTVELVDYAHQKDVEHINMTQNIRVFIGEWITIAPTDVGLSFSNEQALKEACSNFKQKLTASSEYSGEETIEI